MMMTLRVVAMRVSSLLTLEMQDGGQGFRSASRLPVRAALVVGLAVLVVDETAEEPDAGADRGAHGGVAGHGADGRATGRAEDGAARGAALRVGRAGRAPGEGKRDDHDEDDDPDHEASCVRHFARHGNSLMKKRPIVSTAESLRY